MSTSKWSKYDNEILGILAKPSSADMGYSDLARDVLGNDADYQSIDLFRTYIRRHFGHLRKNKDSKEPKILVYDLETTLLRAYVWWSYKQYVHANQIIDEPQILTIAYKWLGDDEVHALEWDGKSDKDLMEKFLVVYNSADQVIGINNKNFDDKWVVTRAMKHGLFVNTYVRSFDLLKKAKSVLRLPSYSMAEMAKYLGVTHKRSHEGRIMWEKAQWGTEEEKREYLDKMVEYNVGDIVTTEEIYYRLRRYLKTETHLGVLQGNPKWSCPECGGRNVELVKTTYTAAGTVQRIMRCNDDDLIYKINNTAYLSMLEDNNGI